MPWPQRLHGCFFVFLRKGFVGTRRNISYQDYGCRGCRRRHSARASSSCAFHRPGVTLALGSLKPRTVFPRLINSSSLLWRKRSRSFCNCLV
jgi:hypothetical protein